MKANNKTDSSDNNVIKWPLSVWVSDPVTGLCHSRTPNDEDLVRRKECTERMAIRKSLRKDRMQ